MDEFETWYPTVREQAGSIVLTIPKTIVEVGGYKVGDKLKIMSKKIEE